MAKPFASLSLDLDNQWSYMKTGAIAGWESFPSYFDVAVPRILSAFDRYGLTATVFVVGQDAALEPNRKYLRRIADAGHEIGNHSFFHEPWLNCQSAPSIAEELARAHDAILAATGQAPVGFRGPGFSISTALLQALTQLGYRYDASTFPTFIGPLARAYYFLTSGFSDGEKQTRAHLFGSLADGLRPLRPYRWTVDGMGVVELPVSTIPLIRAPFHFTYLSFLAGISLAMAIAYFRVALTMCRLAGVQPSLLLHPLDFLGGDDIGCLSGFPGMRMNANAKLALMEKVLDIYARSFEVVPLREHCARAEAAGLRDIEPSFAVDAFPALTDGLQEQVS
ncbi:MAG: polysaccharide deacetylase family protein [Alphaproteobacteria bacterium]|nr:polysaccharide deacetylase family protein [Alphaproteobacteria bacterium]